MRYGIGASLTYTAALVGLIACVLYINNEWTIGLAFAIGGTMAMLIAWWMLTHE